MFSAEYSKSTFRFYLTRPVSREAVLISKIVVVICYTTILLSFFFGYSLLISTLWLGTGELAVFDKGILFLPENEISYRFIIAFVASNLSLIHI